jgi:hypothetical protein
MQGKKAEYIGFSLIVVMFLGIISFAYSVNAISVDQNQDSFVLSDEAPGYAISELVNAGKSKSAKYQKGMPTIRCVCGLRILVVPDLKAMSSAIKNHVAEHKQADYGLAFDSLEEFLTEQILMAAAK